MTTKLPLATVVDDRIVVKTPYAPENVELCRGIPGARWDAVNRAWTYPASPASATYVARAFPFRKPDPAFEALYAEARKVATAAAVKSAGPLRPIECTATEPWRHQLEAYHFAKDLPGAMLAMAMGTGKSKVVVDLIVNNAAKRTLILSPLSVVKVWPKQFQLHAGCEVNTHFPVLEGFLNVIALDAPNVEGKAQLARTALWGDQGNGAGAFVGIVNYESAWREPFAGMALEREWDYVVCDESHKIKAHDGKAAAFAAALAGKARHRLCLSGTPLPHSPLDAFAQYRVVDSGVFGDSWWRFRSEYAVLGGYKSKEVVGYKNIEQFNRKFYSLAFRVYADVNSLPPVTHEERTFTLPAEARKLYKAIQADIRTALEDGTITAANALVEALRLQQITSGHVGLDGGGVKHVHDGKADLLAEVLEGIEPGEKVVVFARFTHDLDEIRKIGESHGRHYGEISGRTKSGLAADGRYETSCDLLGVQIQAGGVGIDLTAARYCVYYSVGYSLGDFDQSRARVHRPGQSRPVTYIHLLAEDTIDAEVYAALREKRAIVNVVLAEIAR